MKDFEKVVLQNEQVSAGRSIDLVDDVDYGRLPIVFKTLRYIVCFTQDNLVGKEIRAQGFKAGVVPFW